MLSLWLSFGRKPWWYFLHCWKFLSMTDDQPFGGTSLVFFRCLFASNGLMTSLCSIRSPDWLSHSSVLTISPDHLAQRITKSTNRDTRASSLRRRASQSSRFDIALRRITSLFRRLPVARPPRCTSRPRRKLRRCRPGFLSGESSSGWGCKRRRGIRCSTWPPGRRSCPAGRALPGTCGWGRWPRRWRWTRRWWPSPDLSSGVAEEGLGCGWTGRRRGRRWRKDTEKRWYTYKTRFKEKAAPFQ